jgi:hypothetical protein
MTECVYPEPLRSFETGIAPEPVHDVDLIGKGPDALREIPGLSMDDWDRAFYHDYFVRKHRRNPTIVEIMDLNNANSEHSRHGYFRGRLVIDGVEQPDSLMDLVKATLQAHPRDSVIAFKDNSSARAALPDRDADARAAGHLGAGATRRDLPRHLHRRDAQLPYRGRALPGGRDRHRGAHP